MQPTPYFFVLRRYASGVTRYHAMKTPRFKRARELAVKTTISLPPRIHDGAMDLVRTEGYMSFSGLIQAVLREKLRPKQQS